MKANTNGAASLGPRSSCKGFIGIPATAKLIVGVCIAAITFANSAAAAADRPNVVLVITDDQGYGDLSCHGNEVLKTPNLDALHAESIRLVDYHVSPTCSPTRSALLTGHWTNRTGVWHTIMGRSLLRENEVTVGEAFRQGGYTTGMFGKWHLGDNYPYLPEHRGFVEVMRHGGGGVGQTPDFWDNAYFDGSYFHNGKVTPVQGFCTDVWFDYAMRFIRSQKKAGKPFFAYISTNAPHGPMHAPEEFSKPYLPQGKHVANFFGMIANIDHNVGRLREFLRDEQLEQNTIFIFTTDNGTSSGGKVFNAGMKGQKGSEYDGGHRVPMFIHWPAGKLTGGRDVTPITAHVDIMPTLLDLCHIPAPTGVAFDGRSIRPLLQPAADSGTARWPDRILVTDSQRVRDPIKWRKSAVMTDRWRLINGSELYDIKADPGQLTNVAAEHPQVTQRLRDFYESWWAELEPTFKVDCQIYLGHPRENPTLLTSHDWITSGATPWNQQMIRRGAAGANVTGFWNVRVVEDGEYQIRLRRWPIEADEQITAGLEPGEPVPGDQAFRAHPGVSIPVVAATIKIGDQQAKKAVENDAKEVVFQLTLKKGTTRMTARFLTEDDRILGAYYAQVEKLEK
jgi:arylsulfatase A-like enzyme